jgi:hypothetical protein
LYNVIITATDKAGNEGTLGDNAAPIDVTSESTAILFEFDNAVPNPAISPKNTDDADAFITVSFASEGKEYFGTDTAATDYDKHDTVTITKATLDGTDITPLATTDDKTFLHKASGLTAGDHTVIVSAKDLAGNEVKDFKGTIKVTERKPFSLSLDPGWNLVSLPGEPADSAVNTVVPAAHPATTILTYDASVPGGWLTAVRGDDGAFAGTLTDITAGRAYWVLTNSFEPISVTIPRLSAGAAMLPPTVSIVEGWNFVPILDVTSGRSDGDKLTPNSVFGNTNISRVYTFDTIGNQWVPVNTALTVVTTTAADTAGTTSDKLAKNVLVGQGYWVYSGKAFTLVP